MNFGLTIKALGSHKSLVKRCQSNYCKILRLVAIFYFLIFASPNKFAKHKLTNVKCMSQWHLAFPQRGPTKATIQFQNMSTSPRESLAPSKQPTLPLLHAHYLFSGLMYLPVLGVSYK